LPLVKTKAKPAAMLVLSHHKCATKWLHAYLSRFAELNSLPFTITHLSFAAPDPVVPLACMVNADYAFSAALPGPKLHVLRNPLDLVVSAYHSHLATHALDDWPELAQQRAALRTLDRAAGMMRTIEFLERPDFYRGAVGSLYALRHWKLDDPAMATLRMEDAVAGNGTLIGSWLRAILPGSDLPDPAEFSFETYSGRRPGEVDDSSHYRAGVAGRWRQELPDAAISYLREVYGAVLARYYPADLE
jgi:hypothetical protein